MVSRQRLTVCAVVVVALAACAVARPDRGGDGDLDKSKNSNEIVQVNPVDDKLQQPAKTIVHSVKVDKSEAAATTAPEADVSKAVNELYPHAVLFGGTCGGTIIGAKWILTAGHCTIFTSGRYVLAGTNNSEDGSGVEVRVKRLVIHPKFTVGPYWLDADQYNIKQVSANWDFLLAELEEPLPLEGIKIAAVELDDGPTIPVGMHVGYAGYGAAHHGDTMRHEMHGMELEIMADKVCEQKFLEYSHEDMICTKGRPPRFDSACNGDSGSGLVANNKLYGVASWVENDSHRCFNGALVIFSRVASVRDWIRQVTSI